MRTFIALRRTMAAVLTAFLVILGTAIPASADWYPISGDIWYDGLYHADSYFMWYDHLGYWDSVHPKYEHDLAVRSDYFTSCTTYTDMPSGYSDCSTAGVREDDPNWKVFGLGTHYAKGLQEYWYYFGEWDFAGGIALQSPFELSAQEVTFKFCPFSWNWCYGSSGDNWRSLTNGTFDWATQQSWSWAY